MQASPAFGKSLLRCGSASFGVHGDVRTLLNAGILQKTDDGLIIFPYDAIRVDVLLHAA